MPSNNKIKEMVKEKYGEIAENKSSCCGPTSCCNTDNKVIDYSILQDDYSGLSGYVADADLGLRSEDTRLNSSHIPLSRMPSSA